MTEEAFIKKRAQGWKRLEELSGMADNGFASLSGNQSLEYVRLYRAASADHAKLIAQGGNEAVVAYLNQLVGKCYGQIYRHPRKRMAKVLTDGLIEGAKVVRRRWAACMFCFALMAAGGLTGYLLLSMRPDLRSSLIAEGTEPLFAKWKEARFEERSGGTSIFMASFYAQNNPRVGVLMNAFSLPTFGLLTAYITWSNGLLLGTLASEMDSVGKLGFLFSSIGAHGVSEIGGFVLTGGAGFVLAGSLIRPGRRTRVAAVKEAGKDSFALLMVGLAMIFAAAPIEGFISFNPSVPQEAKVAFALLSLAGYLAYFLGYGTKSEVEPALPDGS